MKPKILFVDDDSHILNGLRLSLRGMRAEWDMSFAMSGREALDLLSATPHDVVVSDMRMPGMDGGQLLKHIQEQHPRMSRIILSGYSDQETVLRNICLAHQYLSKPCGTSELIQVINNALNLHGILGDEKLKGVIARLESLPALPATYTEMVEALADEKISMKRIGDILAKDMALTASVLRIANCAFFGFAARITSIHHAVSLLGIQTLRTIVLSTHLFTTLAPPEAPLFSVNKLWEHCIRAGGFAKALAERERLPENQRDDCIVGGMLHDIGKLVLATTLRREFTEVLDMVQRENCPVHVAEKTILGTTHAEVGAYLMGLWGFNHAQMAAVRWHHDLQQPLSAGLTPQLVVHAVNYLDHELVTINDHFAARPLLLPPEIGLQDKIDAWREACRKYLELEEPV
jgi:HD-like signal output (HDOD) protein/CheY-like chemotaxis protein